MNQVINAIVICIMITVALHLGACSSDHPEIQTTQPKAAAKPEDGQANEADATKQESVADSELGLEQSAADTTSQAGAAIPADFPIKGLDSLTQALVDQLDATQVQALASELRKVQASGQPLNQALVRQLASQIMVSGAASGSGGTLPGVTGGTNATTAGNTGLGNVLGNLGNFGNPGNTVTGGEGPAASRAGRRPGVLRPLQVHQRVREARLRAQRARQPEPLQPAAAAGFPDAPRLQLEAARRARPARRRDRVRRRRAGGQGPAPQRIRRRPSGVTSKLVSVSFSSLLSVFVVPDRSTFSPDE